MAQTAKDMNSKYKETSQAGLALIRDSLLIRGSSPWNSRLRRHFPLSLAGCGYRTPSAMNRDLQALILAEEAEYASLGRSNIGGWHSRPDFLNRRDPAVSALTAWLTWALRRMIDASAGANAFKGTLSVSAWATLCRAGAYHAPHSHPDSAWSGVYYVDPGTGRPDQPAQRCAGVPRPAGGRGGRDRAGRSIRRAFSGFGRKPGLLVVFPSWLYHWVHPYAGPNTPRRQSRSTPRGARAAATDGLARQ